MEIARPQQTSGTTAAVSLYQQTMSLIEKLYSLPGFDLYLFPQGLDAYANNSNAIAPFEIIWSCFRLGSPFCHLYNQLRPRKRLFVPDVPAVTPPYNNTCKKAVYEFIVACKAELQLSDKELFSISGLYKDDTNEFVKLVDTIAIVVQKIEDMGLFPPPRPLPFSMPSLNGAAKIPSDNRAKVVAEMLNTERMYSTDLEKLQRYQRELQSQNIVPRDMILQLFANLDELLDFQRRFLLQMEATLSLPANEQRVGQLFVQNEQAFSVYIPFCGNYQLATQLAADNAAQLQKVPDMDPIRGLPSYLIKPVQRVCKYPLLLTELIKFTDADSYPYMSELKDGLAAIKRVTDLVNEEKRQDENRRIKADVFERVEDWKGLNISEFGSLLLSDKFPMNNGEAEKDFELFLFENILLCCKDTGKKRKSKKGTKDDATVFALKGNIYIERMDSIADETIPAQQRFQLKVFWRDGMDMESFVLRCRNAEQVNLWKGRIEGLLQVERMRKMSLRETNSYTRSTQLHPDITRGMARAPGSMMQYEDERTSRSERYEVAPSPSNEYPNVVIRSKSIPYNYYPGGAPLQSPYPMESDLPSSSSRKSAPAKPRSSAYGSDYQYSRSRGRSTSPPPHGRIARDSSPPPPMPANATSPSIPSASPSQYDMNYMERKRERSRSRPREEIPRGLPFPPQIPLPDLPTLTINNGRMPPSAPLPSLPDARRPSRSDRGYFDGYEPTSSDQIMVGGRRGDVSPLSELPPSPPASMPSSPIGQRKSSMLPPPIMTGRSVTSPYPLSQLAAGEPPSMNLRADPRAYDIPQQQHSQQQQYNSRSYENGRSNPEVRAYDSGSAATRPGLPYNGSSFSGYEPPSRGAISRVAGSEPNFHRSNSSPDVIRNLRGPVYAPPPNLPLPPTPSSNLSRSMPLPYSLQTQPSSASINSNNPPLTPVSSVPSVRIKMHYGTDVFVVAVPATCTFLELQSKMERKVRICGGAAAASISEGRRFRMRYRDEDGDFIAINDNRDVSMAFEANRQAPESGGFINLWIV
ncbi:hypothetical protein PhCBS80983_g00047 [Powellomyces hirtus]|uniref:DH domain-containing protein n=1 Tax=Powellomyces hirtus TaxID=109895 RepID=A0A507EHX8_9FUNG|nr:hypothetical protein PhCBS80983_g00047 [Powellomyces hirtus]